MIAKVPHIDSIKVDQRKKIQRGRNVPARSPKERASPGDRDIFLGVHLFTDLPLTDSLEIAASIFGVGIESKLATSASRTNAKRNCARVVHAARRHGRFPRPSYTTPGNRGRQVWLIATVDHWRAEYFKLMPKQPLAMSHKERRTFIDDCNDAAVEATRLAEAFDDKLKEKIITQHAGSVLLREGNNERASSGMVAG